MRRSLLTFEVVTIAFSAAALHGAVSRNSDDPAYNHEEVKRMAREARTIEQYTALADYYETRRRMYVRKAGEEMHRWTDRNAQVVPPSEKLSRPVDSARRQYEHYLVQAAKSAAFCAKYNRLAHSLMD